MSIVAFDSGDFTRRKKIDSHEEVVFYTPLGIGIKVKEDQIEKFVTEYHSCCKKQIKSFKIPTARYVYSHDDLWKEIGHAKAIKICDLFIEKLQRFIDSIFVSYVILPPKDIEYVEVGGYGCPLESIKTPRFLRNLSPMFSYLTAWAYSGGHLREKDRYLIDGFTSKMTTAWRDLSEFPNLKIYPKGDECNEFIAIADMLAYLTEKKLWDAKSFLEPESVENVWKKYEFAVELRFHDQNTLSKMRWFSQEPIDTSNFFPRPMVFMDVEGISISRLTRAQVSVATYACSKGGAFLGFDEYIDPNKVRDGDVYVYAGEQAKKRANSFKDMFNIKVYSIREIRKEIHHLL